MGEDYLIVNRLQKHYLKRYLLRTLCYLQSRTQYRLDLLLLVQYLLPRE